MGVIVHLADDLPGLPLANGLLGSICELVATKAADTNFRADLENAVFYHYIDLWNRPLNQREAFALGIEEVHESIKDREGVHPDLLARLLWTAGEIRKTFSEGEQP